MRFRIPFFCLLTNHSQLIVGAPPLARESSRSDAQERALENTDQLRLSKTKKNQFLRTDGLARLRQRLHLGGNPLHISSEK